MAWDWETVDVMDPIDIAELLDKKDALLKREISAASAIVMIGQQEIVVHPAVKVEIDKLREAATFALAKIEKGAPGWGVAKDALRLVLKN